MKRRIWTLNMSVQQIYRHVETRHPDSYRDVSTFPTNKRAIFHKTADIGKKIISSFFIFAFAINSFGSNSHIDSLKKLLTTIKEDTSRIILLNRVSKEYWYLNPDSAIDYAQRTLDLCNIHKSDSVLKAFYKTQESFALNNLGAAQYIKGNYDKALNYYLTALKIKEEINDRDGISATMNNIGAIYHYLDKPEKALDYYIKSLNMHPTLPHNAGTANTLNNIGMIYNEKKEFERALDFHSKALKIREEMNDKQGIAGSLNNIGMVYDRQDDYTRALDFYMQALKINREIKNIQWVAINLNNIGDLYKKQGADAVSKNEGMMAAEMFKKAIQSCFEGLSAAQEIGSKEDIKGAYQIIALCYFNLKKFEEAFKYYKLYSETKDSVFNEESSRQIAEMQARYETEKKEKEILVLKKEQEKQAAVAAAEKKRHFILLVSVSIILLLTAMFALLIYNRFLVTREQKSLIQEQKKMVDEKNTNILDSITYAKRIQTALLTNEGYLQKLLPGSFVIYRPKDIVSGDFYWAMANPLPVPKGGGGLVALGDCTGHGVPGAFLSLLGMSFLNEIIIERQITSPGKVLDNMRQDIIQRLNPDGAEDIKDGMDIALCYFDFQNRMLQFASANIPVFLVRGGKLLEFPPDTMPVGVNFTASKPFALQTIDINPGDNIYILSDGFADQFGSPKLPSLSPKMGGNKTKKFSRNRVKEILIAISLKPMKEQKEVLLKTFDDWKGNGEQTDDVTVIGIRI